MVWRTCRRATSQQKKKLRAGSELELLPVPERGFVFLNKPCGVDTMYLVNTVTLRKVPLPASESGWQLVFSDSGFGAVVNESGEILLVQEIMGRTLLRDAAGDFYIEEKGKQKHPWHLGTKHGMCEQMVVDLSVGSMNCRHEHRVYKLTWPREGYYFYWDALELYTALRLTSFAGKRTVWLYRQKKKHGASSSRKLWAARLMWLVDSIAPRTMANPLRSFPGHARACPAHACLQLG